MDDSGKCVADQAGFADAFKYFQDLKAAGAKYYTDGNALKQDFQTGKLNAVVDGPWQTADFKTALGDKLAVAKMPAGPSGGKLSNFKNELTGCGPFLHDDPRDRPADVFGGTTSLHFGRDKQPYLLVPIIPPKKG